MRYCKIIAELGYNFCGNLQIAKEMINSAKACEVDFVKIQVWSVKNLKKGNWDIDGRRELYKQSELSTYQIEELFEFCKSINIKILVSIFNLEDLKKLPLNYIDIVKIPSTEILNENLLDECKKRFKKILLSVGSSTIEEIEYINDKYRPDCLMHCTNMYPCPIEKANLLKINLLKHLTNNVGFSDHTEGISASIYAISHGCIYIEKHFTTSPLLPGRDNKFSAIPSVMKEICKIRNDLYIMTKRLRCNYQIQEEEMRSSYRGRWTG